MRPAIEFVPCSPEDSILVQEGWRPFEAFNWHCHSACELTLVQEAQGWRYVGDDVSQLESSDLVLLGGGLPHAWRVDGSLYAVVAQFDARCLGEAPELTPLRRLLTQAERGLCFYGDTRERAAVALQSLADQPRTERYLGMLHLLHALSVSEEYRILASPQYAPGAVQGEQRLTRVLAHLHDHFRQPLSLASVAAVAGMSRAAFCRMFQRATGRTMLAYVHALRIGHACQKLKAETTTVATIAHEVGYQNLSHFHRQFRQHTGTTPHRYRTRWRSQ